MAQRIMDKADAGQILVSQAVYDELQPSEKYVNKFRQFWAVGKHNVRYQAFQFVGEGFTGLNADVPWEFQVQTK
jgi:class 3 adenylate cyclase